MLTSYNKIYALILLNMKLMLQYGTSERISTYLSKYLVHWFQDEFHETSLGSTVGGFFGEASTEEREQKD